MTTHTTVTRRRGAMHRPPPDSDARHHHPRRMGGRDPHEAHRVSTPLELLFDLTFATSFGFAASQFAHVMADGHIAAAVLGFGFASFAVCWAWINFSWFASAYDTDDWIFRVVTMVQMIGALVLAIGLPRMFNSIEHGSHLDIAIMVLGYVIMRIALVFQWLRAAGQDPGRRRACITYAVAIAVAQIGWVAQIAVDVPIAATVVIVVILYVIELSGPIIAESKDGGTPWHAHHIAERYSLFVIIAIGERIVGTVATLSAGVDAQGWTMDAALVGVAGTGLTFGLWWVYYMLPSAPILHSHRERSFIWGYGQMMVVTFIVATGGGLHVAAYFIGHKAHIGPVATLLSVAVPVSLLIASAYALYYYLVQRFDPLHTWLLAMTAVVVGIAVAASVAGVDMSVCLFALMLAPAVSVVGYELRGHRHQTEILRQENHPKA